MAGAQRLLTIVIPAFNEAARLPRTLKAVREYVEQTRTPCELIVVDDGSTDATGVVVRQFVAERAETGAVSLPNTQHTALSTRSSTPPQPLPGGRGSDGVTHHSSLITHHSSLVTQHSAPGTQHYLLSVRVLATPTNRGKGHAVRCGMLAAAGDPILMCDADLSAPLDNLAKLQPWLQQGDDVVIGSRDLPDALLDPPQPLARRLAARVFRALRRRLLLPQIRDTQCGFKLFRAAAARAVFAQATVDGWLFDCEALALAERLGFRIKEVGIVWRNDAASRVKPLREAFRAPFELYAIRARVRRVP